MEIQDHDSTTRGYKVNLCHDVGCTLLCPFCKYLMRNPVQTFRGELACEYCYIQAQKKDVSICPIDGEPIESSQVFKDKYKTREILQLPCYCSKRNYGCKWQGALSLVKDHEGSCVYRPVNCYICKKQILVADVHSHIGSCITLRTERKCIYAGCLHTITSVDDLDNHLRTDVIVHSMLYTTEMDNIREEFNNQIHKQAKVQKELQVLVNKLEDRATEMNNNMISLKTKYEETISELKRTVTELEKRSLTSCKKGNVTSESTEDVTASIKVLNQNISDVNLRQQLFENTSYNGRLIWKINDITKRLNQAIIGSVTALHSAPAFTNIYGYKFCGRLYLNGDGVGRGTHISVFFVVMKSEYDNLLAWPFQKVIMMRIINQIDRNRDVIKSFETDRNSSSFMRPKKDMNIASGCPLFISKDRFLNDGFIKDDTVFIDLSVSDVITSSK